MERLVRWLPQRPQPLAIRFLGASAIMAAAIALQLASAYLTRLPGLYVLLVGIFIAAAMFGRGSGIYAAALAAVSGYFTFRWLTPDLQHMPLAAAIVFIVGVALALFSEAFRAALERSVKAERDKDVLFRELQHRTQNSFASMMSLLNMQARASRDPNVKAALEAAIARIYVQSQANTALQRVGDGRVDLRDYIGELCGKVSQSIAGVRPIEINCRLDPVSVAADKAMAIGLITNELITNAVKYAFADGESGNVDVRILLRDDSELELTVQDDGRGFPDDASKGLGTQLVDLLTEQHKGVSARDNANPGARIVVRLPA